MEKQKKRRNGTLENIIDSFQSFEAVVLALFFFDKDKELLDACGYIYTKKFFFFFFFVEVGNIFSNSSKQVQALSKHTTLAGISQMANKAHLLQ